MTPADRDLLGRHLADHGWEPDGHGGWYSPQQAWHVDVDIATNDHLVLSRRGGWSMTLRAEQSPVRGVAGLGLPLKAGAGRGAWLVPPSAALACRADTLAYHARPHGQGVQSILTPAGTLRFKILWPDPLTASLLGVAGRQ